MILKQGVMNLSKTEGGRVSSVKKLVKLWVKVGLCIHKSGYVTNGSGYVISHFNSGKIILSYIKTREEAEVYLQRLYDEIMKDWTFTLEEWECLSSEDKLMVKVKVNKLQKEISQKGI
jgi:ArsR family metal-binding transcriptional regulator